MIIEVVVVMKKVVIISSTVLFIGLVSFLTYFCFIKDHNTVILNGNNNLSLNVNNPYQDEGITIKRGNKVIDSNKYTIYKTENLDTTKLGKYTIKYNIKYKRYHYELERTIEVVDTTPPVITTSKEKVDKDYCKNKITNNFTYSASDNYDGDITNNVTKEEVNDKLILTVKDSSDNTVTKEVPINYLDKPKNKFTLNGNNRVYVKINTTYTESGASYKDGCGNKINANIEVNGTVDTTQVGEYKITYSVPNENTLTRTVYVYENNSDLPTGNKIIYLTFDDGPGYYTNKILSILDKHNVKASFFVTSQFPSYVSLIKDEYNKGHAIAVHTYTHNYDIYKSVESYLDDFNKMNEVIKTYTGSYSKIFRFPGGSSNTVSRSRQKGIMTTLAKKMTEDGYVYFDWNVSSGDASGAGSDRIYSNVVNGVKSCNKCVVLMHDIKSTTANALDRIITDLESNGYTFATLNENSGTFHHSINN